MTFSGQPALTLRDIHKECLRLTAQHYSSKEIARMLGISKHTVDQRLRHATQQLGASSRFDAARRFTELEGRDATASVCDQMIYNAADMFPPPIDGTYGSSGSEQDQLSDRNVSKLQDASSAFSLGDLASLEALLNPVVSIGKESPPSLGLRARTLLVVGIAAVSLLAFGAAVAALEVLSRI
jgi:DNA-binding CsgD family transcriptional regulator